MDEIKVDKDLRIPEPPNYRSYDWWEWVFWGTIIAGLIGGLFTVFK